MDWLSNTIQRLRDWLERREEARTGFHAGEGLMERIRRL